MTREEAIRLWLPIIEKGVEDMSECKEALNMAIKALAQEPCDDVAKERYEDLCEYFGEAKDILKNRADFKAWLGRVKWHIRKAEELSAENDDLRDQLAMRDRFQKQQPCEDAISRQKVLDVINLGWDYRKNCIKAIEKLPPVTPQPKTGHWIWQTEDIYRCSECGNDIRVKEVMNIPQYVRCPMCEAKMVEPQESEEGYGNI